MNRTGLTRFATRAATGRTALFGIEFKLGSACFTAALNAVITTREIAAGGWQPTVNATLRVSRAEITRARLVFTLGATLVRGTSATYRIDEIRDNPASPELVLGLSYDPRAAGF
jgi:hypothetical protein